MSDPLSSNVVAQLRSDPMAALAAALILAGSFPDLVSWAMKAFGGKEGAKTNGELKINGADGTSVHAAKRFSNAPRAKGGRNPRESAARHDQALLALMQANPDATVTEIIRLSGRPRNSAVLSLERLEKAGLVEHASRGKWVAVDPDLLEAPAPRPAGWIAPLSGAVKARHAADGRVRDELTMA
jgi:hypothetical protein